MTGRTVTIEVSREAGALQVSINAADSAGVGDGYRILGPKFAGNSKPLATTTLSERDADEIRAYLDEVSLPATCGEHAEELAELRALFALQQSRLQRAEEAWRAEAPEERALRGPDLGDLLDWLLGERDRLRAHSVTLNAVGYRISDAMAGTKGADEYLGNPLADVERLIAATETTRPLLAAALNALERVGCQFFACPGPDVPPVDMETCYVCELTRKLAAAIGTCCSWHNRTCEPPSELCCGSCTEAAHPDHADGSACIAPDLSRQPAASVRFLLWSGNHQMWWKPGASGYTSYRDEAGRFTEAEAVKHVLASAYHGNIAQVTSMLAVSE